MVRRTILASALAAVVLLAGTAPVPAHAQGGWSTEAVASSEAGSLDCQELLFVGARGSGEPMGFGPTVDVVRQQLSGLVPRRTRAVYLDYPAVSPHSLEVSDLEALLLDQQVPATDYFNSVKTGRDKLTALLADQARRCPQQQVVLVGFSQGAQVVNQALATGADRSRIAATVLVGNPAHFPGQNVRELDGQIDTPAIGLLSTLTFLRRRALDSPTTDHRTAVHNLIAEVFTLYEGQVTTEQLATTLQQGDTVLPPSGYATTFSVCQVGDMVCDAAPPLSRVLASTSSMTDEYARARPIHGGYTEQVMARTTAEVARILNGDPRTGTSPGDAASPSGSTGQTLLWAVLVGQGIVLLAVAALWRRTRRSGP